ncbi:MAG: hypothetical protein JWL75_653 [Parcubacteria group bacterium]|nr:hypothetical protein [Parcubacteria group bacterium]
MPKSPPRDVLQATYDGLGEELTNWSNPGNSDKINISLGLLNAQSADEIATALDNLKRQLVGVSETITVQSGKMIASNDRAETVNTRYANWARWLTIALIATTLVVGLLQAYVIWRTA